jgi:hypothetical protein
MISQFFEEQSDGYRLLYWNGKHRGVPEDFSINRKNVVLMELSKE